MVTVTVRHCQSQSLPKGLRGSARSVPRYEGCFLMFVRDANWVSQDVTAFRGHSRITREVEGANSLLTGAELSLRTEARLSLAICKALWAARPRLRCEGRIPSWLFAW